MNHFLLSRILGILVSVLVFPAVGTSEPNTPKSEKSVRVSIHPKGHIDIVRGNEFEAPDKRGRSLQWMPLSAIVNRGDGTAPYTAWGRLFLDGKRTGPILFGTTFASRS